MNLIADAHGRLCAVELFTPRTAFDATRQADGSIRIVERVERPAPVVRTVKEIGRLPLR